MYTSSIQAVFMTSAHCSQSPLLSTHPPYVMLPPRVCVCAQKGASFMDKGCHTKITCAGREGLTREPAYCATQAKCKVNGGHRGCFVKRTGLQCPKGLCTGTHADMTL